MASCELANERPPRRKSTRPTTTRTRRRRRWARTCAGTTARPRHGDHPRQGDALPAVHGRGRLTRRSPPRLGPVVGPAPGAPGLITLGPSLRSAVTMPPLLGVVTGVLLHVLAEHCLVEASARLPISRRMQARLLGSGGARGSLRSPAERRSAEPSLASLARTPLARPAASFQSAARLRARVARVSLSLPARLSEALPAVAPRARRSPVRRPSLRSGRPLAARFAHVVRSSACSAGLAPLVQRRSPRVARLTVAVRPREAGPLRSPAP